MTGSEVQAPRRVAPVMARRRGEKDVWQIAMVRMPAWVEEPDGERYRPWGAIAASLATGMIAPSTGARTDEAQGQQALEAFEALAATTGDLPGRVQVADAAMAEALAGGVAARGVAVEVWDRLAAIDAAKVALADVAAGPSRIPIATSAPGVGVAELKEFAEAALAFHAAAPWQLLSNEDIVRVESPIPEPRVRYFIVMGEASKEFGMIFVETPDHLLDFLDPDRDRERGFASPIWSVAFWQPWEAPCAEHDLWLDSALPSSPAVGIPMAVRVGPGRRVRRATPRMLAFFAGMLRGIAAVTAADLGRGAWTARAVTSQGEMEVGLRLLGPIV